jgi:hypothetical protein
MLVVIHPFPPFSEPGSEKVIKYIDEDMNCSVLIL